MSIQDSKDTFVNHIYAAMSLVAEKFHMPNSVVGRLFIFHAAIALSEADKDKTAEMLRHMVAYLQAPEGGQKKVSAKKDFDAIGAELSRISLEMAQDRTKPEAPEGTE